MYLRTLTLHNVKLAGRLALSFEERKGVPRMWTVLIGANGTCKTTILQAIAIASSGRNLTEKLASGRLDSLSLRPASRSDADVKIDATFTFGDAGHLNREYPFLPERPDAPPGLLVTMEMKRGRRDWRSSSGWALPDHRKRNRAADDPLEEVRGRAEHVPGWFVAGYGVNRNLPSSDASQLLAAQENRLASIFGRDALTATAFRERFGRQQREGSVRRFDETMARVVSEARLLPGLSDVDLQAKVPVARIQMGGSRQDVALTWLSQGYQSTLAWIADLVGQIIEDAPDHDVGRPEELEGLVLVDEIDLHLHPIWQVDIIRALRKVFPRLQFVVTTHSPIVTAAFSAPEVMVLSVQDGQLAVRCPERDPRTQTISEIYGDVFGVDPLFANPLGKELWEYARLAANPWRDDRDDERMIELQGALRAQEELPAWPVVDRRSA